MGLRKPRNGFEVLGFPRKGTKVEPARPDSEFESSEPGILPVLDNNLGILARYGAEAVRDVIASGDTATGAKVEAKIRSVRDKARESVRILDALVSAYDKASAEVAPKP